MKVYISSVIIIYKDGGDFMNSIQVLDIGFDNKVKANTLIATITVKDYLSLTEPKLTSSFFQRRVLPPTRNRVFRKLIDDLKAGATIPALSIAVLVPFTITEESSLDEVKNQLSAVKPNDISILDGIQRTNCLIEVRNSLTGPELENFLNSKVRMEVWVNISLMGLLYRMVALNAGQTVMTIRHQLEILHAPLKQELQNIVPGLELLEENERSGNRNKVLQFNFSFIVESFMAFLSGDPHVDKRNELAQRLEKIDFMEKHSNVVLNSRQEVENFSFVIGELDQMICNKYGDYEPEEFAELTFSVYSHPYDILGSLPTLVGISAAWGNGYSVYGKEHMKLVMNQLTLAFEQLDDPLAIRMLAEIKKGSTAKRIGEFERELVFKTFQMFIESPDATKWENYWARTFLKVTK